MKFDELIDKKYNINLIENQHIKTYNELLGVWKVNTIEDYLPATLRFIIHTERPFSLARG